MTLAQVSPWQLTTPMGLAALLVFALIAGAARGFSGFGAGLIFIPLASMVVGPKVAAPLLLLIDLVGGLPTLPPAWRQGDRPAVLTMVAGAMIGMPLGLTALVILDPVTVRWGICLIVFGLLGLLLSGWRWRGRAGPTVLFSVGGFGGILSGLAQIGGPPIVAFWLGMSRPLAELRANMMLYFGLTSILSFAVYAWGGLIGLAVLGLSVLVTPAYLVGVMLGMRLFGLADPKVFRRLTLSLIALAAAIGLPIWQ